MSRRRRGRYAPKPHAHKPMLSTTTGAVFCGNPGCTAILTSWESQIKKDCHS